MKFIPDSIQSECVVGSDGSRCVSSVGAKWINSGRSGGGRATADKKISDKLFTLICGVEKNFLRLNTIDPEMIGSLAEFRLRADVSRTFFILSMLPD